MLQLATNAWEREGYSCFPEPPYQGRTYNVPYNYTECFDEILEPSSETVQLTRYISPETPVAGVLAASYFPFGILNVGTNDGVAQVITSLAQLQNRYMRTSGACSYYPELPSSRLSFQSYQSSVTKVDGCTFVDINLAEGVDGWQEILTAHGDVIFEEICATLKQNPTGFRCFNQPKPPTTKEQAIERYASEYPAETICEPLKHNSPFQCTRTVEVPTVTRLSLSLASAQAVFAIVGIIFVTILRKMKVEASSSTPKAEVSEKELRDLIKLYLKRAGGHIV